MTTILCDGWIVNCHILFLGAAWIITRIVVQLSLSCPTWQLWYIVMSGWIIVNGDIPHINHGWILTRAAAQLYLSCPTWQMWYMVMDWWIGHCHLSHPNCKPCPNPNQESCLAVPVMSHLTAAVMDHNGRLPYCHGQNPMVSCHDNGNFYSQVPHYDVITWKHLLCYWPFVTGMHRSLVDSHHKGPVTWALMFSLMLGKQTVEQMVELLVIWDAIIFILTSLLCLGRSIVLVSDVCMSIQLYLLFVCLTFLLRLKIKYNSISYEEQHQCSHYLKCQLSISGIILCMSPANERRRFNAKLAGWIQKWSLQYVMLSCFIHIFFIFFLMVYFIKKGMQTRLLNEVFNKES